MGEKDRQKEQRRAERGSMSEEELQAYRTRRRKERLEVQRERPPSGDSVELVRLRGIDEEGREQIREDLATEASTKRLSTFQIAKRLARFALPHWRSLSFGFLLLILQGVMDLAKPLPLAYSIDSIVTKDDISGATLNALLIAGAVVVLVSFLQGLFSYLDTLIVSRAGRTMARDMRASMFTHVQKLSLQYHARRRTGDLLMRISSDVNGLQRMLTDSVIEMLNSVIMLIGLTIFLMWIDWQIGLIALVSMPIIFFIVKRYSGEIRNVTSAQRRREGAVASLFNEALASTRLSRVFNRENQVRDRFEEQSAISLELGMEASLKEERFTWGIEVLGALLTAAVMIVAVFRTQAGAMTAGELFLAFFYIRQFYRPIRTGIKNASRVFRSLASAERVVELLDMEQGVIDVKNAKPAPPLVGDIEFRDVSFSYDPEQPLMEGVNLKLPAKRVTAVVGPTGAGKTTLVSMVPRLYDPIEGQVLIDGHDIREFTLESLRDQISVVLQEATLMYGSVAENIGFGKPDAEMAEIEAAAWMAGAHDFIKELPQGYQTIIGERGDTLSGGQKQLIAISRAIIRDAPIVILDEPMTGLDAASSNQVRDGLERLTADRTVLFITHNLALVGNADYVVVVDEGKIVQHGTPAELRRDEGLFSQLFRAQFEQDSTVAAAR